MENNTHNCSFCGKNRLNVKKLIAGPEAFICDECVMLSSEILSHEKKDDFLSNDIALLSPKKIKAELDKYVIGQERAKKVLSVVVNNHYKRLMFQNNNEIKSVKTNLLMIGPTSSGKTLLIKVLQKLMARNNIPVAFADATSLTEAGYVGDDVESIILRLLQESDFNVEKAQKGIVFIDEIDKIAQKSGGGSMSRDVSGEGVQQALLGILQGKTALISPQGGRRAPGQEPIAVDTSEILFICAGAFCGLEEIINERNNVEVVGFHTSDQQKIVKKRTYEDVETEDLIKFGMIPEFIGRLPVNVTLDRLTHKQLVDVIREPKNALLKQYENLFNINDARLIFKDDALDEIAKIAIKKQVSARGLAGVIESVLQDTMFELEDNTPCEVIVDREAVINRKPIIRRLSEHVERAPLQEDSDMLENSISVGAKLEKHKSSII